MLISSGPATFNKMALYETQPIDHFDLYLLEISWMPDQVRHDIIKKTVIPGSTRNPESE